MEPSPSRCPAGRAAARARAPTWVGGAPSQGSPPGLSCRASRRVLVPRMLQSGQQWEGKLRHGAGQRLAQRPRGPAAPSPRGGFQGQSCLVLGWGGLGQSPGFGVAVGHCPMSRSSLGSIPERGHRRDWGEIETFCGIFMAFRPHLEQPQREPRLPPPTRVQPPSPSRSPSGSAAG